MKLKTLFSAHRTFAVLLTTIVLLEIAHGVELIALFPLYLSAHMHEGADVIGVTLSSYLIADILTRTPAGWSADRWARKPIVLIGIALSALPLLIMPRIESPALFLALNVINGIGAGCTWPAIYAAVADDYARTRYGLVLGIINMVMLGGIALGPIAGGLLLSRVPYDPAFAICFGIVALAFVFVVLLMRETKTTPVARASLEGTGLRIVIQQFNAPLIRLLSIGLGLTFALGMMLPLISLFGKDVLRVTPDVFALILLPPGILTAALIIPAGRFADVRGRHLPLILGLALIAIPFAAAPLSINPLIVSAGIMVAGSGFALCVPAWNALVMDYVPASARGLFLGAIATAQGVGLAVGPTVGGALWTRIGVYAPFQVAAMLIVGAMALALDQARRNRLAQSS